MFSFCSNKYVFSYKMFSFCNKKACFYLKNVLPEHSFVVPGTSLGAHVSVVAQVNEELNNMSWGTGN